MLRWLASHLVAPATTVPGDDVERSAALLALVLAPAYPAVSPATGPPRQPPEVRAGTVTA